MKKNSWHLNSYKQGDYFSVRSVFIKKTTKLIFLKKTETGLNRPVSVQFGFLDKNQFKPVCLGFFWFDLVFWFGFFGFELIKPKPNRTCQFFQNFNRFFSRFGF
jgi:hypothetical protein